MREYVCLFVYLCIKHMSMWMYVTWNVEAYNARICNGRLQVCGIWSSNNCGRVYGEIKEALELDPSSTNRFLIDTRQMLRTFSPYTVSYSVSALYRVTPYAFHPFNVYIHSWWWLRLYERLFVSCWLHFTTTQMDASLFVLDSPVFSWKEAIATPR